MTDQAQPAQEPAATQAGDSPAAAPPKKKKLLMTVAGVVAGGLVGAFVLGPAVTPGSAAAGPKAAHEEGSSGSHEGPVSIAQPHMIENLVVNPAGSRGTRFLLLSIGIIMADPTADDELRRRDAEARDRLVQVLSAKNVEELVDVSRRDGIKHDLAAAIDSLFIGRSHVKTVLLPQFVVQ